MTAEEKAKRYDEALEKARKMYNSKWHPFGDYNNADLENLFPELAESEDERIRKHLIDCVTRTIPEADAFKEISKEQILAWLEKQGEQKPIIDGILTATNYDKMFQNCKVHKFNIGDWVVRGNTIAQILDIQEQFYVGLDINGKDFTSSRFLNDDKIHLWTIQDAKDGDVLVTKEDGRPFIFNGLLDKSHPESPVAYCGIDDDDDFFVSISGDKWWTGKEVCPSTKEQRDLLFQKMNDAGYEWNADKKKLKKKPQRMISAEAKEALYDKAAWSEEDEKMLYDAIGAVGAADYYTYDDKVEIERWLKSLKQRIGG